MISGVIRFALNEILGDRKKTLYRLQKETGIAYTTLLHLSKGNGKGITFDVLEKICVNLDCKPNDLIKIED